MKALAVAFALAVAPMAMSVGGCATIQTETDARHLLYGAALAYEGALDTVTVAARNGTLKGENAAKAKVVLDQAQVALLAAKSSGSVSGARRVFIILSALEPLTNGR